MAESEDAQEAGIVRGIDCAKGRGNVSRRCQQFAKRGERSVNEAQERRPGPHEERTGDDKVTYCGHGAQPFEALGKQCCAPTKMSERDVAVFLFGVNVALVFKGAQRSDDEAASVRRLDDAVEIAAFGGNERIGETVAKFGDFFLA